MLQRLMMALSIGAALAVLAVLIVKTQGRAQALTVHLERMSAVSQLAEANTELDRQIARARLSLDAEPSGLLEAGERLERTRAALAVQADGLRSVSPPVAKAYSELLSAVDGKHALLADYRSQLSRFAGDYARLRRQAEAVLADPALPADAGLRRQLMRLLEEITAYSLQAAPTNGAAVASLAADLGVAARDSGSLRSGLLALVTSAGSVQDGKDNLRAMATRLDGFSPDATLERLRRHYIEHHARIEASTTRYRQVLAVYASTLLIVFGFVGWRLRRSHAELHDVNAHLEETVEARTGELRKALEELRLQQAQLIQSEKMAALGQMVAGVAHEINTPLGYARGNIETVRESLPLVREFCDAQASGDAVRQQEALRRWPPEECLAEIAQLLGDAEYGMGQISELVLGLKDFSRLDRSLTELFDINEAIDTALKICHSQIKGRVTVNKDYGALPRIPCAPSQLNQVFLNLLTNAAQAIDGEGSISIATRAGDEEVEIEIRDSGCGMDEQTQAHIFEPFFTTKPVGHGTGLGLSIVFRIIEDHRGRITVESTPGEGAVFRLVLPRQAAAAAAAVSTPDPREAAPTRALLEEVPA